MSSGQNQCRQKKVMKKENVSLDIIQKRSFKGDFERICFSNQSILFDLVKHRSTDPFNRNK